MARALATLKVPPEEVLLERNSIILELPLSADGEEAGPVEMSGRMTSAQFENTSYQRIFCWTRQKQPDSQCNLVEGV